MPAFTHMDRHGAFCFLWSQRRLVRDALAAGDAGTGGDAQGAGCVAVDAAPVHGRADGLVLVGHMAGGAWRAKHGEGPLTSSPA